MRPHPQPVPGFTFRFSIRQRRYALGYRAADVAALLTPPRSRQWLRSIETAAKFPTLQQLMQLALILDVSPWWHLVELVPVGDTPEALAASAAAVRHQQGFPTTAEALCTYRRLLRTEAHSLTAAAQPEVHARTALLLPASC